MARIIKIGEMFYGVSHKYNTAGNPIKLGQKPYIISKGIKRLNVLRKLRKMGYAI
jgi:hypothetical protein